MKRLILLMVLLPISIFGELGFSFSTGYGLPLPFEYVGYTFSDSSSYHEVWSSFGNGVKFNFEVKSPVNSNVTLTSGIDATFLGSIVLPKTSEAYHYHDKISQTLGGFYLGIETVSQIRRWLLSVSLEPGIYLPYNVTVLRQYRNGDKYLNWFANSEVFSDTYRCYYNYSWGFSSNFRIGYKTTQKSFVFLSIRPSIIHARLKSYVQNINGVETSYTVRYARPTFAYSSDSEIMRMFPIDFSSIGVSVGVEYFSKRH